MKSRKVFEIWYRENYGSHAPDGTAAEVVSNVGDLLDLIRLALDMEEDDV